MGELGQLGLGEDIMEKKKPYPVGGALKDKNVVQVSCGGVHTVVLTDEGHIYSWGCNDEGALGRSIDSVDEYCPGLVDHLKDVRIVQVSAGDSHTVALSESGDVYCCGIFRDSDGPFGLIDDKPSMKPQVVYSDGSNKVIKVVSGAHHVAMLTEHGDIFTFG
jgi:regulator of chromosome condensation